MQLRSGSIVGGKPPPQDASEFPLACGFSELRYLQTAEMPSDVMFRIPFMATFGVNWQFTPSGAVGVQVVFPNTNFRREERDPVQLLMYDVYNKIWFRHPLEHQNLNWEDVFTYHMVNETELVIIQMSGDSRVRQHLYKIDMEKRKVEYVKIVVHSFLPRNLPPDSLVPWKTNGWYNRDSPTDTFHTSVKIRGKYHTALVSNRTGFDLRRTIYLVPLLPCDPHVKPMEFSVNLALSPNDKEIYDNLLDWFEPTFAGYDFRREVLSSGNLLYLLPILKSSEYHGKFRGIGYGIYRTIDVTKLIDIHEKTIERNSQEEKDLDERQAAALGVKTESFAEFCLYELAMFSSGAVDGDYVARTGKIVWSFHVLSTNKLSYLQRFNMMGGECMHPSGCLLQFGQDLMSRQLFVRAINTHKTSLYSLALGKVLFKKTDLTEKVFDERIHRLVFGMAPIKLDKEAEKALQPYKKWVNMFKQDRPF